MQFPYPSCITTRRLISLYAFWPSQVVLMCDPLGSVPPPAGTCGRAGSVQSIMNTRPTLKNLFWSFSGIWQYPVQLVLYTWVEATSVLIRTLIEGFVILWTGFSPNGLWNRHLGFWIRFYTNVNTSYMPWEVYWTIPSSAEGPRVMLESPGSKLWEPPCALSGGP
jgi:hypothetical protein